MTETACQHEWQPTDSGYACTTCTATTPACTECGRPMTTSLAVCNPCLERARRVVADVAEWMTTFEFGVQLINLRAIRYDRDRVTTSDDDARLPFGLDQIVTDPEDTRITAAKHPHDAIAVLHDWATAWADHRGEHTGGDLLGYLLDHILWAIQNPNDSAWPDFINEARQVRATVRRLLGIAPQREPVPCVHCGGRIVRDWTDDGLDDLRRCTSCGTEWPDAARLAHTNALVLHALPATHPDTLVTTNDAKRIYRGTVRPNLIDLWAHREKITPISTDARGRALYRLGDIEALVHPKDATA